MIISLDTSTPTCFIGVYDGQTWHEYSWEAGRELARNIFDYLNEALGHHQQTIKDVSGIIVLRGPGSFTGLRIGLTVMNTLADSQSIPIVGGMGDTWRAEGLGRLQDGHNDKLVMPEYGGVPNITTPRK